MTHTRTYARITPANPYLACAECHRRVRYWHDKPGPIVNQPCGHAADYDDTCPSWGPVDGCRCPVPRPFDHLHDPAPRGRTTPR